MTTFRKELECLINQHSMENGSDTPDFILAEYLTGCLSSFDKAVKRRQDWYYPGDAPSVDTRVIIEEASSNAKKPDKMWVERSEYIIPDESIPKGVLKK